MKKKEESAVLARHHDGGHFRGDLRDELVKAMEAGTSKSAIAYQYGVAKRTLYDWMRNHGSKEYQSKQRGAHLTEAEKRSIVRLIEQGELTPHAARKANGEYYVK
jgi:transposase-like protein